MRRRPARRRRAGVGSGDRRQVTAAGCAGDRRTGRTLRSLRRGANPRPGRSSPWPTASPSSGRDELTGPLVERWIDDVVTVDEDAIADAMVFLMDRAKLYVEGAGAVGVAAMQSRTRRPARHGHHVHRAVRGQPRPRRGAWSDPPPRDRSRPPPRRRGDDRRPSGRPGQVAPGVRRGRRQPHRGPPRPRGRRICTSARPPSTPRSRCAASTTPSPSSTPFAPLATGISASTPADREASLPTGR